MPSTPPNKRMLDLAAHLASRAAGHVEPNPMVGAVITDASGRILGMGHHQRYGGPHAEVEALRDCTSRGHDPRGGTIFVTLEPCDHTGKTPPCTGALLRAGIARVVIARADPNPISAGGAERLKREGIAVEFDASSQLAFHLADPFIKRTLIGLPWVIAKWAQTIDGRVATRTGESKWISSPASRHHVHRIRARIDGILTGIGTVLADDPQLTARPSSPSSRARPRRIARRIVIDPNLELPPDCRLIQTLPLAPLTIACLPSAIAARSDFAASLKHQGVEILACDHAPHSAFMPAAAPTTSTRPHLPLEPILRYLVRVHDATNILVEAGPGLLGGFFAADLVDEVHAYIAPMLIGDPEAPGAVRLPDAAARSLADASTLRLSRVRRIGPDVLHIYRATGGLSASA